MLRLDEPLNVAEKTAIVECFWRVKPPTLNMIRYESYFEFYTQEMKALCLAFDKEDSVLERMAAKTHEDVRLIVHQLAEDEDLDLFRAIAKLKILFPKYENDVTAIRLSIDLALRVWLFLDSREYSPTANTISRPSSRWETDHHSLKSFITWQFPSTARVPSVSGGTLDSSLTAYNLHRLYGITVRWTNFLTKHLYYDLTSQTLYIFPHKTCLLGILNESGKASSSIHSKQLIQETIWSLNLLFPPDAKETAKFLGRLDHDFHEHPPFIHSADLADLTQYNHWHDRLSQLRHIFANKPRNFRAALIDNRDTLQLYTLWTAVIIFLLTIVFGLISSVTAIIQTRVAIQGLRLQVEHSTQLQRCK